MSTLIRPAARADIEVVADIFGWYAEHTLSTFEETARPERDWAELLVRLAGLHLPFLVAQDDGKVAGYAYARPWRGQPAYRYTVEDSVFVGHGRTGRGLGRLLLGTLLDVCAQGGLRQMIAVIADTGDPTSAALHSAFGFATAGRLAAVGYKHGRWIDTMLMQRAI